MTKDSTIQQIEAMFTVLHKQSAAKALPGPGTLSKKLSELVEGATADTSTIDRSTFAFFATASVEMWHRSIHSFLLSASLTKASPLWASVSGYYSSHYTIRAFAHLLGYFQLQRKRRIIKVEISGSRYVCQIIQKQGSDREHKFYWKTVKNHAHFASDPFFTKNEEGQNNSDSAHRSKANYVDHINRFPPFQVLNENYLKQRVEKIADMEFSDAPIPRVDSYPDTDNVQLIAYHRMIKFRIFLDEILGGKNRFWTVYRNPGWCSDFLDFQGLQPKYASIYKELV